MNKTTAKAQPKRKESGPPSKRREQSGGFRLDRIFYSLSDPVRLGIVAKLIRQGDCTCTELDCGRPKSTMSHHFKVLRDAGLVETRAQGVTHINSLRRAEVDAAFPGLLDVVAAATLAK